MPIDVPLMIAAEYREMPGLCLTLAQECRLWNLDASTCEPALMVLVGAGVLHRPARGHFAILPTASRTRSPHLPEPSLQLAAAVS